MDKQVENAQENPTDDPVAGKWNFYDYGTQKYRQFPTEAKLRERAAKDLTGALQAAADDETGEWPIVDPDGRDRSYDIKVPKLRPEEIVIHPAGAENPSQAIESQWSETMEKEVTETEAESVWEGMTDPERRRFLASVGMRYYEADAYVWVPWTDLGEEVQTLVADGIAETVPAENPMANPPIGPGGRCPEDYIRRKGYWRDAFTATRDGKRVKVPRTYVPAACIEDRGKPGKTPAEERWAKVEPGKLRGWTKDMPAGKRRAILRKIAKRETYATAVQRLNQLRNLTTDRETKRAAKTDMEWMDRHRKELGAKSNPYYDDDGCGCGEDDTQ